MEGIGVFCDLGVLEWRNRHPLDPPSPVNLLVSGFQRVQCFQLREATFV